MEVAIFNVEPACLRLGDVFLETLFAFLPRVDLITVPDPVLVFSALDSIATTDFLAFWTVRGDLNPVEDLFFATLEGFLMA